MFHRDRKITANWAAFCWKRKGNSLSQAPLKPGGSHRRVEMVSGGFLWNGTALAPHFLLACVWHDEVIQVPQDTLRDS